MSTSSNFDAQYDELAALSSIFSRDQEFEFAPLDESGDCGAGIGWQGHFLIDPLIPSPPLNVAFAADGPQHGTTVIPVHSLPPIELHFSLPAGYPTTALPHLHVFCEWAPFALLASMTSAVERVAQSSFAVQSPALFEVRDAVMQAWSTYLPTNGDHSRSLSLQVESREALKLIREHDRSVQASKLATQPYTCLICLDTHAGESAVVLPGCLHRFCRSCIVDFFSLLINEGMPRQVKCPHPDCSSAPSDSADATALALSPPPGRANPSADVDEELASATRLLASHPIQPSFLDSLLGPDLASTFTTLYLSRAYAADPTMHWCPVSACGGPARGHADPSTYAKLATCLRCQFSFCIHCSRAYHGSVQHCELKHSNAVMDEYFAAMALTSQAAKEKQLAPLFVKYGRTVVEELAKRCEAEILAMKSETEGISQQYMAMINKLHLVDSRTQKWVRENAMACPKCGVRVIRTGGCAHMTCAICSESFCYHCGEVLVLVGSHYAVPGTRCYRRMFD